MAEFRQWKINDLVARLLSLETEDHGKQHTLVCAEPYMFAVEERVKDA